MDRDTLVRLAISLRYAVPPVGTELAQWTAYAERVIEEARCRGIIVEVRPRPAND